ncbi:MAG: response regulator transcription factor [Opitutae bacterium]|nr:response regulator transcription factor [Opitutae bacterium]
MLSQSNKEKDVYEAILNGADGYLLKPSTVHQIKDGIRSVIKGGSPLDADVASYILKTIKTTRAKDPSTNSLSKRELETLALVAEGLSKKEIAEQLGIRPTTVVTHVGHIYQKLNAANAPSAVAEAYKTGLLSIEKK